MPQLKYRFMVSAPLTPFTYQIRITFCRVPISVFRRISHTFTRNNRSKVARVVVILVCGYLLVAGCAQQAHLTAGGKTSSVLTAFLDAQSSMVLVAAHRAAHQNHPENSLPAIRAARELGVDIVELDLKVTRDGVPVLMHDRTIDRTTTGSGDPETMTWRELRGYRLIHRRDTTPHRVASFREALKVLGPNMLVDIDLKTDRVEPIIDVIQKMGRQRQVFFFDNDYELLDQIRAMDASLLVMPRAYSHEMADSALVRFSPPVVHIDPSFSTTETVSLIKQHDARVWLNALGKADQRFGTPKEKQMLDDLLGRGANIVQTDRPAALLAALRTRGLHP